MLSYVLRDLRRNPRRTVASVAGVALAVALFSGISLFVDSASSQMTARAIAPVAVDMQAGLNNPLAPPLSLTEAASPSSATAGQTLTLTLAVTNSDTVPASGVVVKDTAAAPLVYVPGSARLAGVAVADAQAATGSSDVNPLAKGLPLGTMSAGGTAVITYQARAGADIAAAVTLTFNGTVQSARDPTPVAANIQAAANVTRIVNGIRRVPGVSGAQLFASADLPSGSLHLGTAVITGGLKVVAFDAQYLSTFPAVTLTSGTLTPGAAVLSQPAADLLRRGGPAGTPLRLTVPGGKTPLTLRQSGVADFSRAAHLFVSRSPDTKGEFSGAPFVLVVDLNTFQHTILPSLRADAASASPVVKAPPIVEVHVRVARDVLATDPSTAAVTTAGLRRTIERVAPGDIAAIDNLSDALNGAKTDSILAKVLFIFLGLPGVLLGAYLSRYAGGLLAQAQRRERATLRARGVRPAALLRALAYSTAAVAVLGSAVGLALSLLVVTLLFRDASSLQVGASSYLTAAGLAGGAALITTTVALYLPGRRALAREVVDERRELESGAKPVWVRMRLDVILLATAAVVSLVTFLTGGYKPAPAAEAASISLSFYVLLAPLLFWVGATLLAARGVLALAARWGRRATVSDFRRGMVRRTLALSLLRRPQSAGSGIIALSLAIAFGVSLATFVGTYQSEKLADAHFVVGGDVRVTAGVQRPGASTLASSLRVPGVQAVTPVATSSVIVGTETRSLAAIDPATFDQVAHVNPSFITGMTPAQAMAALAADPKAALIDTEIARTFNIQVGDTVRVQVPNRLTSRPVPFTFKAVAAFTRFPGFPPGVDFVAGLSTYQAISGTTAADFYLLATDGTDATNAAVVSSITSGPGKSTGLLLDSTGTAINQEQSTLSALNISGLGRLEIVYTLLMSALGITIFVFGILLQRRKENVTMRALGMRMRHLQSLIIGEAGVVTIFGLVIGAAVGLVMALLSIQILQPVFTIPPAGLFLPWPSLALLGCLVVGAMLGASLVAGLALRRAHLVEILREE